MGEVVSLNKFRKAKGKQQAKKQAAENRVRHGESGAAKRERTAAEKLESTQHDGHKLEGDTPTEE